MVPAYAHSLTDDLSAGAIFSFGYEKMSLIDYGYIGRDLAGKPEILKFAQDGGRNRLEAVRVEVFTTDTKTWV